MSHSTFYNSLSSISVDASATVDIIQTLRSGVRPGVVILGLEQFPDEVSSQVRPDDVDGVRLWTMSEHYFRRGHVNILRINVSNEDLLITGMAADNLFDINQWGYMRAVEKERKLFKRATRKISVAVRALGAAARRATKIIKSNDASGVELLPYSQSVEGGAIQFYDYARLVSRAGARDEIHLGAAALEAAEYIHGRAMRN